MKISNEIGYKVGKVISDKLKEYGYKDVDVIYGFNFVGGTFLKEIDGVNYCVRMMDFGWVYPSALEEILPKAEKHFSRYMSDKKD